MIMKIIKKISIIILSIPFILIGLVFDIIKLPVIVFIILPLWLIMGIVLYIKTGSWTNTITEIGEIWYLGVLITSDLCFTKYSK